MVKLAHYQTDTWLTFLEFKRLLIVKSNKVGESTKWLLVDFQLAVLPSSNPLSCRGYDQLVIAQSKDHAKEHLRTLRKMIIDSPKYSKYLINKPTEIAENANRDINSILKDEQSKTSVIYIYNPDNPAKPSRIMALGIENDGAILSWKNVKHIHMSDVTAAEGDIEPGVNAAMTRLANTDGSMVIETVPGDPHGKVWDMYNFYKDNEWKSGDFKVKTILAGDAVKAGIMTAEFIESEKRRLGPMFPRYYEASFAGGGGNVFTLEAIEACTKIEYNPDEWIQAPMSVSVDPGFGSSNNAVMVTRLANGRIEVLYCDEIEKGDFNELVDLVVGKVAEYKVNLTGGDKVYVDGSDPELIRALKRIFQERTDYDEHIKNIDKMKGNYEHIMKVVPVYFGKENVSMLTWLQQLVSEGQVAIDKRFDKLLTQMRSATTTDKGSLDKKKGMTMDSLDTFQMNAKRYHY